MTNLETICKKLIWSCLYKHHDENMDLSWHLTYDRHPFKKLSSPTETIDEAIDYFYKAVLQYENNERGLVGKDE